MNRGDGRAAAAYYADDGGMEEMSESPSLVTSGRKAIAARLEDLYRMGLRLAPAGSPITYDKYVAEPVRFFNGRRPGRGAGMLVFEFNPAYEIVHEWVIGWVDESAGGSETAAPATTSSPADAGPGEIAFTKGTLSGDDLIHGGGHLPGARRRHGTHSAWSTTPGCAGTRPGPRTAPGSPTSTERRVQVMNADGSGQRPMTPTRLVGRPGPLALVVA